MSTYPPFRLNWVEIKKRRISDYAETLLAAAGQAVDARDAEIVKLKEYITALETLHAVTEDRHATFGDYFTIDHDGPKQGLYMLHDDNPRRLCTVETGDRVFVLRRRTRPVRTIGVLPSPVAPPGGTGSSSSVA